jgi:hypothetical protein
MFSAGIWAVYLIQDSQYHIPGVMRFPRFRTHHSSVVKDSLQYHNLGFIAVSQCRILHNFIVQDSPQFHITGFTRFKGTRFIIVLLSRIHILAHLRIHCRFEIYDQSQFQDRYFTKSTVKKSSMRYSFISITTVSQSTINTTLPITIEIEVSQYPQ